VVAGNLVVVCDPNPQAQRALQTILRRAGYRVLETGAGAEALEVVEREHPRAIILELALPDTGGVELCRQLRARGQIAILVLSAIHDDQAKVAALEAGADDYMTKPFSPAELVARLAARLRTAPSELRIDLDGLVIDLAGHLVTVDGREVHLTPIEFALLRALATSRGTVSYGALSSAVWGPLQSDAAPRLRTHIASLRAKLDGDHRRHLIRTEAGVGYRFTGAAPPVATAD
jgi:two-component system, OmpR family, KDP operon response regulator KdpE